MIPDFDALEPFFREHLLGERYFRAAGTEKTAARSMAVRDICAALGVPELPETPAALVTAAVGEQMLHLLEELPRLLAGEPRIVSESVEGIGSRTYQLTASGALGERARQCVEQLLGRTGGALPLRRG